MTVKEFQDTVDKYVDGRLFGLSVDEETGEYVEPYFSWHACHTCDSHLGGTRHDGVLLTPGHDDMEEVSICVDCLFYLECGDLPTHLDD